ncbi:MAG: hypothetical protein J6C04_01175, partial [Oscillospiraceae bacterium]|nr:hypothetical protein [Oscillospiraceae bacterium]
MTRVSRTTTRNKIIQTACEYFFERDYLRNDHINRAKRIFADHCRDWTDEDFVQAELLIMGIQYTTITADDSILPLKTRIGGALEYILNIYGIYSKTRQKLNCSAGGIYLPENCWEISVYQI